MFKRINLLFDASSIVEGFSSYGLDRSGIYWVSYNLLKHFNSAPAYKITLMVSPCTFFIKKRIANHFQSSYNYITFYDKEKSHHNIIALKSKITNTRNILKICYYILRIIENLLYMYLSKSLPKKLNHFDIFVSPKYSIPDIIKSNPFVKHFQVLYDCIPCIFKELYPFINSNHWYMKVIKSLNKDTYYFCISENTKNDFLRIFHAQLDSGKMFVIMNASALNFSPQYSKEILYAKLKKYNINLDANSQYILSLCTIEPRKNLLFAVKCFIEFLKMHQVDNLYFYLGGGHFSGYIDQLKQNISGFSEYQDKIIILGYVDDSDVNILFSNSLFFVYLSQYEGFGMPPLEAMQAGTPVICSNNSSLPEVVGDAAITIQYNDETSCIEAMEKLYFNETLRKDYISKGLERGKLFSWEKTFKQVNDVIMSLHN